MMMMNETNELRPCPFCGGEMELDDNNLEWAKEHIESGHDYAVGAQCKGCGTRLYMHSSEVEDPKDAESVIRALRDKINHRFEEKRPSVFLSGAIKDDPHYKEKFAEVAAVLRCKGYDVINPAETVLDEYAGYKDYIDHALAQLMTADLYCQVWYKNTIIASTGADLEFDYASTVRIPRVTALVDEESGEVAFR